jgi:hypothetical protein
VTTSALLAISSKPKILRLSWCSVGWTIHSRALPTRCGKGRQRGSRLNNLTRTLRVQEPPKGGLDYEPPLSNHFLKALLHPAVVTRHDKYDPMLLDPFLSRLKERIELRTAYVHRLLHNCPAAICSHLRREISPSVGNSYSVQR